MPDQENWRTPEVLVPAGGGVGGLLSIVLPKLGVSPAVFPSAWWTPLAGIFVGAVAAFIGVFLLFNTDRSDKPRLIAWAILLGILWQPVIAAGTLFVENLVTQRRTESRTAETVAAISQIASAPPTTRSSEELADATTKIVELAQRAGDIRDEDARHAVGAQLAKAVGDLQLISEKNPAYHRIAADTIRRANAVVAEDRLPALKAALRRDDEKLK